MEEVLRGRRNQLRSRASWRKIQIEEPRREKEEKSRSFDTGDSALIQELQPPDSLEEAEAPVSSRRSSLQVSSERRRPRNGFWKRSRPRPGVFDRQMEEVIGKGVQEMMEGFITKVLPEMTQNILNLTVERIEKMVKEIVPDLAEKAIQEEIRRLKKGDKD